MLQRNIPILRIFDVAKAKEFYIDWLGFVIEWEHPLDADSPVFMSIKKDDVQIFLSEHYGDGTPGSHVFIVCSEIEKFHNELKSRPYKYYNPGLEKTFYNALEVSVQDPFGNKLSFNEYLPEKD